MNNYSVISRRWLLCAIGFASAGGPALVRASKGINAECTDGGEGQGSRRIEYVSEEGVFDTDSGIVATSGPITELWALISKDVQLCSEWYAVVIDTADGNRAYCAELQRRSIGYSLAARFGGISVQAASALIQSIKRTPRAGLPTVTKTGGRFFFLLRLDEAAVTIYAFPESVTDSLVSDLARVVQDPYHRLAVMASGVYVVDAGSAWLPLVGKIGT